MLSNWASIDSVHENQKNERNMTLLLLSYILVVNYMSNKSIRSVSGSIALSSPLPLLSSYDCKISIASHPMRIKIVLSTRTNSRPHLDPIHSPNHQMDRTKHPIELQPTSNWPNSSSRHPTTSRTSCRSNAHMSFS